MKPLLKIEFSEFGLVGSEIALVRFFSMLVIALVTAVFMALSVPSTVMSKVGRSA